MFNKLFEEETDIFAFSAYLKPGLHSIIIYDPVENLYYKKTMVVELNNQNEKKIILENMLDELNTEMSRKFKMKSNVFN